MKKHTNFTDEIEHFEDTTWDRIVLTTMIVLMALAIGFILIDVDVEAIGTSIFNFVDGTCVDLYSRFICNGFSN